MAWTEQLCRIGNECHLLREVNPLNSRKNGHETSRDNVKACVPYIFSLAPKADLSSYDSNNSTFEVYRDYLTEVFREPSVHNLAITGGYGIGKSSIIRSFDAHYSESGGKEEEFLYISLGSYEEAEDVEDDNSDEHSADEDAETEGIEDDDSGEHSTDEDAETEDTGNSNSKSPIVGGAGGPSAGKAINDKPHPKKEKSISEKEISAIERRLLLQIFVQFRRADIPLSRFKLIREPVIARPETFARFTTALVSALCILSFHEPLGVLLTEAAEKISSSKILRPILGPILGWMVEYKPLIHFALCVFVLALSALAVYHFCHFAISRLRFNGLSIKSENAEISWEQLDCEDCIDKYIMELVYCLEQIADKVKHTVVFEDMDRLPPEVALRIFTRLREINKLANSRLKGQNSRIRFVYVINNHLVSSLEHTKFFDFVLPVFPSLNCVTAASIFRNNLEKVNQSIVADTLICQQLCNSYRLDQNRGADGFVHQIAPFLSDYRRQYTILNEYGIALRMYCLHNSEKLKSNAWRNMPLSILAASVYKNFWPDDYHTILDNKSVVFKSKVFPTRDWQALEQERFPHINLLKILDPYLTLESLTCVGFDKRILIDSVCQNWKNRIDDPAGIAKDIDSFTKENFIFLEAVWTFCGDWTDNERKKRKQILEAAVRCAIRCEAKREDKLWFFRNRDLLECCEILAGEALKDLTYAQKEAFCECDKAITSSWRSLLKECSKSTESLESLPWGGLEQEFRRIEPYIWN